MNQPADEVEFEQMLLNRHTLLSQYGGRRKGSMLDRSAYVLLSRLRVQGPMSIGELSEAFGLDASTLNRQTAAALRAGLVERMPDPAGGMARKFGITEEGTRRLAEEREGIVDSLKRIMDGWSDEDMISFTVFLRRFNHGIERLTGRPWPRPGEPAGAAGAASAEPTEHAEWCAEHPERTPQARHFPAPGV
ncbi:MarR family transcriptional regulator [Streptomyces sp. NPDC093109]|uniref:MarR family winged helix-turn-helix transcriptional regulator n=1 Tax=Streptomyces sp. NPDC093109 TaxID=3154977 RepID=UPI00344E13C5